MADLRVPGAVAPNVAPPAAPIKGAGVRIVGLSKHYGEVVAIDRVNLEIRPGEFLTLLGPSGSGKTTTLMTVAGFEVPTAGEIFINDRAVSLVPPHRRDIGMVFQNYALFPHMTVAENIAFPLRMRKMARSEQLERVRRVLQLVRLPQLEHRFPSQLSGGQQQRIALARAIVYDPPLLLMDEPLGALDKQLREELQLEIKRLQNALHITVIYVTHDQTEALVMSDRIAVFNHGRIEQLGTPEDLYDRPANHFVAAFLGESNFLTGAVLAADGRVCTVQLNDGTRLRVLAGGEERVGAQATVAVRPEKVLLGDDAEGRANALRAVVREVIFVGEVRRYEVSLPSGESLVVKQTNRQGVHGPTRGDEVMVGWHEQDSRIVERQG